MVLLAVVVLIIGANGCGGSNGSGDAVKPGSPSASAGSEGAETLPTDDQLRAALLSAADLGPGFALPSASSDSDGESGVTGCPELEALFSSFDVPAPGRQQDVNFRAGGGTGPVAVGESLTTAPAGVLDALHDRARSALTACDSVTFTETGEEPLTFALSPIHFGGPGSAAIRMDGEYRGIVEMNGYLAVERVGSVELAFVYLQAGGSSSQLASAFYRRAVEKVGSTLGATSGAPR